MTTNQAEFAERCAAVAADLALLYAGEPDDKVASSVAQMRANLQTELAKVFAPGADVGTAVDMFIEAVITRKVEIEAVSIARGGGLN